MIATTKAATQARILVFHQAFDACIFEHVDIRVQTGKLCTRLEQGDGVGTARILRMTDFMRDQQIILIHADRFKLRQQ